jgi:hypothetical protein
MKKEAKESEKTDNHGIGFSGFGNVFIRVRGKATLRDMRRRQTIN